MILLCPGDVDGSITERFRELGIKFQPFEASQEVHLLDPDTAGDVMIVPIPFLSKAEWPQLRSRIWAANRLFVAIGTKPNTERIVNATRDGAHDVLSLADDDDRWDEVLDKAEQSQKLWLQLYGAGAGDTKGILLGDSAAMKALRNAVDRLGPTKATVLVMAESGAGKECVAQALHQAGGGGPFVPVNCAAIPKDLLESELFGAERGSFSGSIKDKPGLVEQAEGGSLFLDEIGEMDISLQPKLLRFLETRKARRVGAMKEYSVDVRVISATNRNVEEEIAKGAFRSDLFYRLSEITLRIPPLRQRLDDIPGFARAFLAQSCERFGKHYDRIEPELIAKFQTYSWPGNARELKSAIDKMVILFDGPVLRAQWWDRPADSAVTFHNPAPAAPSAPSGYPAPSAPAEPSGYAAPTSTMPSAPMASSPAFLPNSKQKMELARRLLDESHDNYSWVSAQLGINVSTLYRWRKSGKVA